MARARNHSRGNNYFPCDVDILWNKKVRKLKRQYGPLGIAVWIGLLCKVFDNDDHGYYIEVDLDDLADDLIDDIGGSQWCRSTDKMRDVILYCADIGLLAKDLVMQGVITSYGIQEQYKAMMKAAGRKLIVDKYWLLQDDPVKSAGTPDDFVVPTNKQDINLSYQDNGLSYQDKVQSYLDSTTKRNRNKIEIEKEI